MDADTAFESVAGAYETPELPHTLPRVNYLKNTGQLDELLSKVKHKKEIFTTHSTACNYPDAYPLFGHYPLYFRFPFSTSSILGRAAFLNELMGRSLAIKRSQERN